MSGKVTNTQTKSYGAAFKLAVFFGLLWITWVTVTLGASFGQRHPGTTSAPTNYPTLNPNNRPTVSPTKKPTSNPTKNPTTLSPTTAKPTTASPTP